MKNACKKQKSTLTTIHSSAITYRYTKGYRVQRNGITLHFTDIVILGIKKCYDLFGSYKRRPAKWMLGG